MPAQAEFRWSEPILTGSSFFLRNRSSPLQLIQGPAQPVLPNLKPEILRLCRRATYGVSYG